MATPTLDEIEARLNVQQSDLARDYQLAIMALVAHVRALHVMTAGIDAMQGSHGVGIRNAAERITALEAKVAALSAADDVGRAAARAESATSPRMAQKAWAPVAEELDRLRAENAAQSKALEEALLLGKDALFAAQAREQKLAEENAELREKLAKTAEALDNTRQTSFSTAQKLRVENAELRKRVEALTDVPAPEQPIETAPLAEILTYPLGNPERKGWAREWPSTGETVDEWRAILKKWGRTHWLPMPPPPGGAK